VGRGGRRPLAGADREAARAGRRAWLGARLLDGGERRRVRHVTGEERVQRTAPPPDLDHDAARVVADPAGEPQLAREAVGVRAEADALHDAGDADADALPRDDAHAAASTSSRSTCQALACASWMRGMCSERVTIATSARSSATIRPPS